MARVLNVNVGILGHVDSGKTSLARALSTKLSTAALDKHPQSVERGITLDLGFSAFLVDVPSDLQDLPYDQVQFTLVDCPGHASLIRTIIGGAQIIDVMMLVIDVTKGVQTQTAECMVVGEISPTRETVVVLNKIDLLEASARDAALAKLTRRLRATFRGTKFADAPMVAVAARPGGPDNSDGPLGVDTLIQELSSRIKCVRRRSKGGPFLFSVDHCFPIRGQGTVMTGTVLQGSVTLSQLIEIPALKIQKKVKSMQMFHCPVTSAVQGDRVGICVTQLDAKLLERGLVAEPGTIPTISGAVAAVEKIRFFKSPVLSKSKVHVTVGHETVMAQVMFFGANAADDAAAAAADGDSQGASTGGPELPCLAALSLSLPSAIDFDFGQAYRYQDELLGSEGDDAEPPSTSGGGSQATASGGSEVEAQAERRRRPRLRQWALLTFDAPITCPSNSLLIGSKLDTDIHSNTCRLAFFGRICAAINPHDKPSLQRLRVFKVKRREGVLDRVVDANSVIGRGLFKKETDMSLFLNLRVTTPSGHLGTIQSAFGKSGKFKVVFSGGVPPSFHDPNGNKTLVLEFRRFVFDSSKRMMQDW